MPYCCQCGKPVVEADLYCRSCGASQAGGPRPPSPVYHAGPSPRGASLLCYLPFVGWIAAIVVLASDRYRANRVVRFHAFQGLYLFVAWLIVQWVVPHRIPFLLFTGPHIPLEAMLKVVIIGVWVFMMVKVNHDEMYSLPIIGELAEKSLSES